MPAAYARRYCQMGLALTPLRAGSKVPKLPAWEDVENTIRDPDQAFAYWSANKYEGMGAVLGHSGLVSLDADDVARARTVLLALGVDLGELRKLAPAIIGNPARFRLEFKAPAGVTLQRRTARWPKQDDPTKHAVIFELRAGDVQDVLPPSRHPDTGGYYVWDPPPTTGFPDLPRSLLALWSGWPATNDKILRLCPWYTPPVPPAPRRTQRRADQRSVIAAFNDAHDVTALLESHGYTKQGKRWLSPSSSTKVAGVVVLDTGKVYFHNESDALADGHSHDAFDLYTQLDHGGDVHRAVKAAAQLLKLA